MKKIISKLGQQKKITFHKKLNAFSKNSCPSIFYKSRTLEIGLKKKDQIGSDQIFLIFESQSQKILVEVHILFLRFHYQV